MDEHSPNTIRHTAGCGLVKGPDEESIILVSYPACELALFEEEVNLTKILNSGSIKSFYFVDAVCSKKIKYGCSYHHII